MDDERIRATFCDPSVERAVLSCCMKSRSAFLTVMAKAGIRDFLESSHRELLQVLISLYDQNVKKFDVSTIITEAKLDDRLKKIFGGDENYIYAIYEMPDILPENLNIWLDKLIDISKKHTAYVTLIRLQNEVLDNKQPVDRNKNAVELITEAENELMRINFASSLPDEPIDLAEGLEEWYEELVENPVDIVGLSTGYPILDELIDGLVPRTLNIVAARRKMGKSAFLMNVSQYVAYRWKERKPVLYLDTEMSIEEFRPRLIASLSSVPEKNIRRGDLDESERRRVVAAIEIIKKGKLFHHYVPGFTVDQIVSLFKMYKVKEDIGLGVFDYVKMPGNSDVRNLKEYQILGDVTTKLKDLSGILDIPLLCAVQMNREGQVADSDKIERYGDVIMEWNYRSDKELEETNGDTRVGRFKLIVRASRRGGETPEKGIGFDFRKSTLTISEIPKAFQLVNFDRLAIDEYDDEELEIAEPEKEDEQIEEEEAMF